MFIPLGDIRERIDAIFKQYAGVGWRNLPQELVDEILRYFLDDLDTLKACSLTCKPLFGATRPLIHQRFCLASRPAWMERSKPKSSLFGLRWGGPEAFERLVDADRSGLLHYTRHLIFKMDAGSVNPENIPKYHPHLRSITNLHSLTLVFFRAHQFIPVFNECFGMFTNTLRHLDIRNAYGTDRQLLYIISQFPLLEDLTIVSPTEVTTHPGPPFPPITHSPLLRGTLVFVEADSKELFDGLATLPGGINCRSLESFRCRDLQVVLDACGHSLTSMSYLSPVRRGDGGEPNSSIRAHTAI